MQLVSGGDRVENALCKILEYRVFKEVKKIVEMIDERADASAKWTSYALLFDVRICSMYVTGLHSQDGRIAPN